MNSGLKRASMGALGFGLLTGLRSFSGPAWFSKKAAQEPGALHHSPLAWLARPETAGLLGVLAGLEMAGDKLPMTPDRTSRLALLGRAASGALVGAAAFATEEEPLVWGAALGALAAVAATFAGYHLRREAANRLPVPDSLLGVAEDILVGAAGARLSAGS